MNLLLFGIFFLLISALFLVLLFRPKIPIDSFLRARWSGYGFFTLGSVCFLSSIWGLGEADFGNYRDFLLLFFAGIFFLSFLYVPDYLSVRGISVLLLLVCRRFLDLVYLDFGVLSLFFAGSLYFLILAALYFAVFPYRFRDLVCSPFGKCLLAGFSIFLSIVSLLLGGANA